MSTLHVDLDLVKKYNVAGPRYTSYPPATHFTDKVTADEVSGHIRANNETARDLSLYFHLPFCETLCWFCGCTTIITTSQEKSASYIDYVIREMTAMRSRLHGDRKVVQLHFGGGTPTFSHPDQLRKLGAAIHENFPFAEDLEAAVEVDPRRLTEDHLKALREIGFNRASMGVQDNNPEVQLAVHRIQPLEMTRRVAGWVRDHGFKSLNVDLIFGLPLQTVSSFERTIDDVLALNPDRFAVFSYAHVPWMKPAQKIVQRASLPTPETKLQLLRLTVEKLTSAGYVYIGMDHFARETDELAVSQQRKTLQRNFQGYSTKGGADIYAFGMSSISQAGPAYWQNLKELPEYYAAVEKDALPFSRGYILTADDLIRRQTIMEVMCNLGLDYATMSARLSVNFESYFERELASLSDLEADGLVQRVPGGIEVTLLGRLFIRIVAMRFDPYLAKQQQERRYSQTI